MVTTLETMAQNAKLASYTLASLSSLTKDKALLAIADKLEQNKPLILEENKKDLEEAKKLLESGEINQSTYNRLKLDDNKMRDMIQGIRDVKKLEDPVNKKLWAMGLDTGLDLYRVSCPIGVIGVIFEARPDVIPPSLFSCNKKCKCCPFKRRERSLSHKCHSDKTHKRSPS